MKKTITRKPETKQTAKPIRIYVTGDHPTTDYYIVYRRGLEPLILCAHHYEEYQRRMSNNSIPDPANLVGCSSRPGSPYSNKSAAVMYRRGKVAGSSNA